MISASHLHLKKNGHTIIRDLSVDVPVGTKIGIMGATGSGKSSLLKLLGGLEKPDAGEIYFLGKKLKNPDEQLIPGHPQIAWMDQHAILRNHYIVSTFLELTSKQNPEFEHEVFKICEIRHLLNRFTHQLSGGEKQRVYLASLLIRNPKMLLLDEPFSGQDYFHQSLMLKILEELIQKSPMTILRVSHDHTDLLSWSDHLLLMRNGEIVQFGEPKDVYQNPTDEYSAGLLGPYTIINDPKVLAALFHENDMPKSGKSIFRPNEFIIESADKNDISAIIKSRKYLGPFYLYEVISGNCNFIVLSAQGHWNPGESCSIQLNFSVV